MKNLAQNTDAHIALWNGFLYCISIWWILEMENTHCNSLFINVPSEKFKKHADIKMTINLICNYVLLYTMSKTNKSFTRPNVFYLNILHNFKDSFLFMFTLIICLLFTFINILNSQFKIYSRMGGDIFWVGVEWPSWHILQQFCSNFIPILHPYAWNLTSCPVSFVFLVQWLKSILGCN